MELRQLRYFKMVADAGSFARGAQDLRVAQPALSRSIAKLEDEMGTLLFVRHSAGISFTDAGRRFYEHATQVLGTVNELVEAMGAADGAPRGTVTLGAPHSMVAKLTLPVATEFLSRFSHCRLDLIENSGARLRTQVAEGALDLAVVPNAADGGMHITPLFRESICLICRREDRHSFGERVDLTDILHLPLILTGYPGSLRLHIARQFPSQSDAMNVRSEVNSSAVVAELVLNEVGFGIAPAFLVANRTETELDFVPINDLTVSWKLASNWLRRGVRAVEEAERMIVGHVREAVESGLWPTAEIET